MLPNRLIIFVFGVFTLAAAPVNADLASESLPDNAQWYAHADLKAMQGSRTGRHILEFLEEEVFKELEEETGITLQEDLLAATIFGGSSSADGAVVLYGKISAKNRTKMQALMELYGDYSKEQRKGVEIFSLDRRQRSGESLDDDSSEVFSQGRTTYVAFSQRDQVMVTQSQDRLESFVAAGGRLRGDGDRKTQGKLLVLQADKSMVNAGMNAGAGISADKNWDSSILQHMQQVAMVVADQEGKAAIEARLVTSNQQLAESIKNIVQGVISIKALDQNADPELLEILRSVKLQLEGSTIQARVLVDPDTLKAFMD